jgi:hypothetical protein
MTIPLTAEHAFMALGFGLIVACVVTLSWLAMIWLDALAVEEDEDDFEEGA